MTVLFADVVDSTRLVDGARPGGRPRPAQRDLPAAGRRGPPLRRDPGEVHRRRHLRRVRLPHRARRRRRPGGAGGPGHARHRQDGRDRPRRPAAAPAHRAGHRRGRGRRLVGRPAGDRPGGAHRGPDPAGGRARPDPPVGQDPAGGPRHRRGRPAGRRSRSAASASRSRWWRCSGSPPPSRPPSRWSAARPTCPGWSAPSTTPPTTTAWCCWWATPGWASRPWPGRPRPRSATGSTVLWGRCLPDWQSLPFWPVREVLAAAAGMAPTEPAGVLTSSIGQLVAETWPDPLAAPATAEALCRLAGLELDEPGPAAQPGPGSTRELAAALAGVLCGLARDERVLVVLEDLHWATRRPAGGGLDPGHRRLPVPGPARLPGHQPARAPRPAGLAAPDRDPADRPRPPGRAAGGRAARLGPRRRPRARPGRPGVRRHQGQPPVRQGAGPRPPGGRPGRAPGQPSLPIPDSLQALVAARLDRLPLSAKRVLCRAAVVGKWFSHAALAAMAQPGDGGLDADLDRLVRAGLIERLPERLAGGQERFAFHHALFRDVAYGILPKAGRSELHRRLADWLAGAPGEEPSLPEVVAYHLVQAVRLAGEVRAPTADDRELAARAVAACQRAARRLRDQEAMAGAARVLDDAVGLAGLAGTGAEELAELRLERGTVRGATGDLPGALADLGPATGSSRPAVRARAWTELSNLHGMFGQFASSAAAADHAIVEAAEAGDPALIAQATRAKAYVPYLAGDLAGAGRLLDEALVQARRAGQAKLVIELRATLLPLRLYLATPLDELRGRGPRAGRGRPLGRPAQRRGGGPGDPGRGGLAPGRPGRRRGPLRRRQPAQPRGRLHPQAAVVAARPGPGGDRPGPAGDGPAAGPGGDRAHHPAGRHRRRRGRAAPGRGLPGRRRPGRGGGGHDPRLGGAPGGRRVLTGQAAADRGQAGRGVRRPGGGGGPAGAVPGRAGGDRPPPRPAALAGRPGPALRRAGRDDEADAAARRARDQATAMGAHALVRHLTQAEGVGR